MDSAKIFALGLAAGLTIHVVLRSKAKQAHKEGGSEKIEAVSIAKSSKSKKNKKKAKDVATQAAVGVDAGTAAPTEGKNTVAKPASTAAKTEEPAAAPTASKKKNKKKAAPPAAPAEESYAAVAETAPAINNETLRAKADAAQTAFTDSLGDMRDADVDPLPAGYASVARIPAPETDAAKPKLSKKELDDGWSSVGGTFASSSASSPAVKVNASSSKTNGSIASSNPFAALPDDAPTASVRRIPAKASTSNGWTPAPSSSSAKSRINLNVNLNEETKKQRSNANKTQAKKAAKEEADRLQAERLANHRRQQASEAARSRDVAKRPTPQSVHASAKTPTAKASVDLNGRLVWD